MMHFCKDNVFRCVQFVNEPLRLYFVRDLVCQCIVEEYTEPAS